MRKFLVIAVVLVFLTGLLFFTTSASALAVQETKKTAPNIAELTANPGQLLQMTPASNFVGTTTANGFGFYDNGKIDGLCYDAIPANKWTALLRIDDSTTMQYVQLVCLVYHDVQDSAGAIYKNTMVQKTGIRSAALINDDVKNSRTYHVRFEEGARVLATPPASHVTTAVLEKMKKTPASITTCLV